MGAEISVEERLFELKFTAKQLAKQSQKMEKQEKVSHNSGKWGRFEWRSARGKDCVVCSGSNPPLLCGLQGGERFYVFEWWGMGSFFRPSHRGVVLVVVGREAQGEAGYRKGQHGRCTHLRGECHPEQEPVH
jgi:hypothetical protein